MGAPMFERHQNVFSHQKQNGGLPSPIDSGHPMATGRNHQQQQLEMLPSGSSHPCTNGERDRRVCYAAHSCCHEEQQRRGVTFARQSQPLPFQNFTIERIQDCGNSSLPNSFQSQSQRYSYCEQEAAAQLRSLHQRSYSGENAPSNPDYGGNSNLVQSLSNRNTSLQRNNTLAVADDVLDSTVIDAGVDCNADFLPRVSNMEALPANSNAVVVGHSTTNCQSDRIGKATDLIGPLQHDSHSSLGLQRSPHGLQLHTSKEGFDSRTPAAPTASSTATSFKGSSLHPIAEDCTRTSYPHLETWSPSSIELNYALQDSTLTRGLHQDHQYENITRQRTRNEMVGTKAQCRSSSEELLHGPSSGFTRFSSSENLASQLGNSGVPNSKWQRHILRNEASAPRSKWHKNFQRGFGHGSPKSMPRELPRPLENETGVVCSNSDGSIIANTRNTGIGLPLDGDRNLHRLGVPQLDFGQRRRDSWNYTGRVGPPNFNRMPSRHVPSGNKTALPIDYLFSGQECVFQGDPQHQQRQDQPKNNAKGPLAPLVPPPIISQNMNMEELARFRTQICPRKAYDDSCALDEHCPYSHCLSWHRRDPFVSGYRPSLCPNVIFCVGPNRKMRVKNFCKRGRQCLHSHTKEEQMYHPKVYKTQLCRDWPYCFKHFCPFAHGPAELRDIDVVQFNVAEGPEKLEPGVEQQRSMAADSSLGGRGSYPGYPSCTGRVSSDNNRSRLQPPLHQTTKPRYNGMNEDGDLLRQSGSTATTTAAASSRMTSARTTSSAATTSNDYGGNINSGSGGTVGNAASIGVGNCGPLGRGANEELDQRAISGDEMAFDGQSIAEPKQLTPEKECLPYTCGVEERVGCPRRLPSVENGQPQLFQLQDGNGYTPSVKQQRSIPLKYRGSYPYQNDDGLELNKTLSDTETNTGCRNGNSDNIRNTGDKGKSGCNSAGFNHTLYKQVEHVIPSLRSDDSQKRTVMSVIGTASAESGKPISAAYRVSASTRTAPAESAGAAVGESPATNQEDRLFRMSYDIWDRVNGLPLISSHLEPCVNVLAQGGRDGSHDECRQSNMQTHVNCYATTNDGKLQGQIARLDGYDTASNVRSSASDLGHIKTLKHSGQNLNNTVENHFVGFEGSSTGPRSKPATSSEPILESNPARYLGGFSTNLRSSYEAVLEKEESSKIEAPSLSLQFLQSYSRQQGGNLNGHLTLPERSVTWTSELAGKNPGMENFHGVNLGNGNNTSMTTIPTTLSPSSLSTSACRLIATDLDRILYSVDNWSETQGLIEKQAMSLPLDSTAPSALSAEAKPLADDSLSPSESKSMTSTRGGNDKAISQNPSPGRRRSTIASGSGAPPAVVGARLDGNDSIECGLPVQVGVEFFQAQSDVRANNSWNILGHLPDDKSATAATGVEVSRNGGSTNISQNYGATHKSCYGESMQPQGRHAANMEGENTSATAHGNNHCRVKSPSSLWCSWSLPPFLDLDQHPSSVGRSCTSSPTTTQKSSQSNAAEESTNTTATSSTETTGALGATGGINPGTVTLPPYGTDTSGGSNHGPGTSNVRLPWATSENSKWISSSGQVLLPNAKVNASETQQAPSNCEELANRMIKATQSDPSGNCGAFEVLMLPAGVSLTNRADDGNISDPVTSTHGSAAASPNQEAREQQLLAMLMGLLSSNGDARPNIHTHQIETSASSAASVVTGDRAVNSSGECVGNNASDEIITKRLQIQSPDSNAGSVRCGDLKAGHNDGSSNDGGTSGHQSDPDNSKNLVPAAITNPVVGTLLYSLREKGGSGSQNVGGASWSMPETPSTASSSRSLIPIVLQSRKDLVDDTCVGAANSRSSVYPCSNTVTKATNNCSSISNGNSNTNNNHLMAAMLEMLGRCGTSSVESNTTVHAANGGRNGGQSSIAEEALKDDYTTHGGLVIGQGQHYSSSAKLFTPGFSPAPGVLSSDSNSLLGRRAVPAMQQRPVSRVASDMSLLTCASGSDMDSTGEILGRYAHEEDYVNAGGTSNTGRGQNVSQGELAAAIDCYLRAHYRDDGMETPVRKVTNPAPPFTEALERGVSEAGYLSGGASISFEKVDKTERRPTGTLAAGT